MPGWEHLELAALLDQGLGVERTASMGRESRGRNYLPTPSWGVVLQSTGRFRSDAYRSCQLSVTRHVRRVGG